MVKYLSVIEISKSGIFQKEALEIIVVKEESLALF